MLLHAFYGKGGPRPPFIFQRGGGAFLRKGGAKFFSSVHYIIKTLSHACTKDKVLCIPENISSEALVAGKKFEDIFTRGDLEAIW